MDDLDLGATIRGFSPGQKLFGRYTLKAQLGRGGMGVVWRARDESLERDVAIKMLPEVVANDPSAVRDLKRETAKSQQLSHPHILRIYDFVEAGPLCGITMELVEGGTLTAKRLEQPGEVFTVAALQTWVGQLCEALEYAHSREKIVHRDLKPANLMLTADGQLKVADFGIAASVSDSVSRVSQQGGSSGTPVYMSPQQMMGEKPAVSDDIYALGATLYELLTGKPPFYSGNIIMQVQNKVPPPVTERRAELGVNGEPIPPAWEATIAACLAKEPKDRPQSAASVWKFIDGTIPLAAKMPKQSPAVYSDGSAATPGGGQAVAGPIRANRTLIYLGIVIFVGIIGATSWYAMFHKPALEKAAEAANWQRKVTAGDFSSAVHRWPSEGSVREIVLGRDLVESDHFLNAAQVCIVSAHAWKNGWNSDPDIIGRGLKLRNGFDGVIVGVYAGSDAVDVMIPARSNKSPQQIAAEQQRVELEHARGGMIVRTTPSGAEVLVGSLAVEKSPMTLRDQRLGRYPVRIRLAGYEDWEGQIEVKKGEFAELEILLKREPDTYFVKAGDTAMKIARDNGFTVAELYAANPEADWRRLTLGQVLKLPKKKDAVDSINVSEKFRAFVADVAIAGVFYGNPSRVMINGRTFRAGDTVEQDGGIVFVGADAEKKTITFQDRAGATLTKKL
ncbi:MAG: protein kinase [Opitutaceae bacterium]|nr:protein kinase [Opitutaceae bacterium]